MHLLFVLCTKHIFSWPRSHVPFMQGLFMFSGLYLLLVHVHTNVFLLNCIFSYFPLTEGVSMKLINL